jgi:hypothetical protein
MVGSSKILTVSYGTFSCTLEGFDDSFDTMKAIAEYFRDLAADDRYFGAEPPTPDAEMLARIAERETARRVEARMGSSGIVLRAAIADEAVAAPAREPVRAEATPEPTPAPKAAADEMFAPPMPAPRDEPPAPVDAESVAAKLQRIRAVVGRSAAANASESYVEDLPLAEVVADPVVEEAFDDEDLDIAMAEPVEAFDEEAFEEPTQTYEEPVAAEADEVEVEVEEGIAEALSDEGGFEDEDEDAVYAGAEEILAEIPEEIVAEEVSEEDIAELEALIAAVDDEEDYAGEDYIDDEASEDDEAAVAEAEEFEDDEDGWDEVDDDLSADGTIEEPISSKVFQLTEAMEADDEADEAYAEDDFDDEDDADLIAAIAAEAEDDQDDDEAAPDLAGLDGLEELEAFAEFDDGELSDEEEAALMRDLALADADEIDEEDAAELTFDDEDLDEEEIEAVESAREILGAEPDEDEAAMARIMSQTDAEMDQPENRVRRDAIAHLKAAYAATEAARALGENPGDDTEVRSAFRQDLDTVIRPVRRVPRPESGEPRPERPERPRAAPLRLVASQRVDIEPVKAAPAAISPARPRRAEPLERPQAAAPRGAGSFADYAEEVGATSLAELLEAAAAYTFYVEGVDEFSRPQIMKKVRDLSPDDFNREDGLRSFGTLLRQGRIMKIRNGRFQISEQTRFRPEPRAAQG